MNYAAYGNKYVYQNNKTFYNKRLQKSNFGTVKNFKSTRNTT